MKQINKIEVMVLTWSLLLFVSCTNPAKNNASNVDKPKENQAVAVDTVTQSKITSEVIEKEVIDGWLKESIKQ